MDEIELLREALRKKEEECKLWKGNNDRIIIELRENVKRRNLAESYLIKANKRIKSLKVDKEEIFNHICHLKDYFEEIKDLYECDTSKAYEDDVRNIVNECRRERKQIFLE